MDTFFLFGQTCWLGETERGVGGEEGEMGGLELKS